MPTRTLSELAEITGARLEGPGEPRSIGARKVRGPAALDDAGADEISFVANPRYEKGLETTRAGAVIVGKDVASSRSDLPLLRCDDPNRAFSKVVRTFAADEPGPERGVQASAVVHPEARIAEDACIGELCVVGRGATIGARAVLHAGCIVASNASIGADTVLFPNVVVYAGVTIGARCTVQAGTVLGSEGFGFEPTADGWDKVPQCGTVVVGDDVHLGACCTVDRARFGATRIGRGAIIDNHVHLGHNVTVGEGACLVAQVGISGSSHVGPRAILAGQVGVPGHVKIGAGARVGAQSGLFGDVPEGADFLGYPARPRLDTLRAMALTRRLPELVARIEELEERLRRLEGGEGA